MKGSINTPEESTVVVSKMELYELLRKADGADVDFLREHSSPRPYPTEAVARVAARAGGCPALTVVEAGG